MNLNNKEILNLFLSSLNIRMIETALANEYFKQEIRTPIHLSIGQEISASSICNLLGKNDYVISHHRSHGHYLAKGGSITKFFSELYGKKNGCSNGNGGSMHLIDLSKNFLGSTAIVSNSIPVGAGFAYSLKLKNKKNRICIFVGDAGTEEGVFYETLNFVSLKKLPVIFYCENNQYSVNSHLNKRRNNKIEIFNIAKSFKIKSFKLKDSDPIKFYSKLKIILKTYPNQPLFIEVLTNRFCEHTGPKINYKFVGSNKKDTLTILKNHLLRKKILDQEKLVKIQKNIENKIIKSFKLAKNSPNPDYKKFLKIYS